MIDLNDAPSQSEITAADLAVYAELEAELYRGMFPPPHDYPVQPQNEPQPVAAEDTRCTPSCLEGATPSRPGASQIPPSPPAAYQHQPGTEPEATAEVWPALQEPQINQSKTPSEAPTSSSLRKPEPSVEVLSLPEAQSSPMMARAPMGKEENEIAQKVMKARQATLGGNGGLDRKVSVAHCTEPLPLKRAIKAPPPCPVDILPAVLRDAAYSLHKSVQAPLAMCMNAVLAAGAFAVQGHADIIIDGRIVPLSGNFITIGESGERKSAVDDQVLRPHTERQRELKEFYAKEMKAYRYQHMTWEKKIKAAMNKKEKGDEERARAIKEAGPEPEREHYLFLTSYLQPGAD